MLTGMLSINSNKQTNKQLNKQTNKQTNKQNMYQYEWVIHYVNTTIIKLAHNPQYVSMFPTVEPGAGAEDDNNIRDWVWAVTGMLGHDSQSSLLSTVSKHFSYSQLLLYI